MKKIIIRFLAAFVLLSGVSCSKPVMISPEVRRYMDDIVNIYLVNHLMVMERALQNPDGFDKQGEDLWETGTVWTGSGILELSGVRIEKTREDSTWVMTRNDLASWNSRPAYPTESQVTVRMLPTREDAARHDWQLFVNHFLRTETNDYVAAFYMEQPAVFQTEAREPTWKYCYGTFWMTVTKAEGFKDRGCLTYHGSYYEFRNNL